MSKNYYLNLMVVLLSAVFVLGACSPQAGPVATATSQPVAAATSEPVAAATSQPVASPTPSGPVVLRFAIADNHGEPSEPYAQEFIDQVKNLSDGEIIIEPIWDSGDASQAGFEGRIVEQVKSGQADVGLAASRAWDTQDILSFQALQAPFLIDNDALAEAVATSDIAARMLADLSQYGMTGLALWPEDLRHPFSLMPDKSILSPTDFAGRNVRVTTSRTSERLIETFGGAPSYGSGDYEVAESGLRQGLSLSGTPTATGNVTFFPKYQVLFVNGDAFGKLSEAQQAILGEAAAAAQKKAIAEHPSEVEAARTWCSDFGAVVLASDEQIAAFEKAAQPVFDWIEQDPRNAELVAAIRELKAKTPASPAVEACAYALAQPVPTLDASAQTWSTGLPPNGVWQNTLTNDDVINMGVSVGKAPDWSGVNTFTFQDGVFHYTWEGTEGYGKGQTASADGTYEVVEDFVRLTTADFSDDIQWRLDEEGLHFHLLATVNDPFTEVRATFEAKPYQKVETWSTGLPPNGVWQVTLTNDDVIKMGVSVGKAPDWSGVYTLTFQDGNYTISWLGTEDYGKGDTMLCKGPMVLVEDYVSITFTKIGGNDCFGDTDAFQWRIDEQGLLHFHMVNNPAIEVKAAYEAKPYEKIADQ